MKKIKRWIIGLAMVALPVTAIFAPQYAPFIPVAKDVLAYIVGDNGTSLVKQWTE
jgi:hypothetical protein